MCVFYCKGHYWYGNDILEFKSILIIRGVDILGARITSNPVTGYFNWALFKQMNEDENAIYLN